MEIKCFIKQENIQYFFSEGCQIDSKYKKKLEKRKVNNYYKTNSENNLNTQLKEGNYLSEIKK
ncbi:unnamed protein product [Paramecium pentaurelia]|uniref:Uncharacterized protein n=1 Tax=Paramecium pentaurelia TaxID=43138 RepID=A0A8S1XE61_9CILI|nr:unnamed protein product [Paramecium pentaurelia]